MSETILVEEKEEDSEPVSAVIVDIDGTIALMNGRTPYEYHRVNEDAPNAPIIELVRMLAGSNAIIYCSGRESSCRKETLEWLEANNLPEGSLFMRSQGDLRKDSVIKKNIYEKYIQDRFNVKYVLEDRNQVVEMWRSLGLTVLQVAGGDF